MSFRVHQVLSGAGPYDAVTTQALAFRDLFRAWGWRGHDVAAEIDPRIGDRIDPLRSLDARDGDVLLVHYSAYAPKLRAVLELPQRKLLISHNITPARWFWDHDPQAGVVCALGRKQLPQFAAAVDVAAGVSLYNAREFGSDVVIPILFDPAALSAPRAAEDPQRWVAAGPADDPLRRAPGAAQAPGRGDPRVRAVPPPPRARRAARARRRADQLGLRRGDAGPRRGAVPGPRDDRVRV